MNIVADKIEEVRLLVNKGWCKGSAHRVTSAGIVQCCLVGGIGDVAKLIPCSVERNKLLNTLYKKIQTAIKQLFPDRCTEEILLSIFNDHSDTTLEDVNKVLIRAKKLANAGI